MVEILHLYAKMEISFEERVCTTIADTTTKFSSRSSKRTDALHTLVKDEIERVNPRLHCEVEHRFKIETGTYDCDIAVFAADTVVACISIKASMTNIKQNKCNLETVKLGETLKLRDAIPSTARIAFFDVVPVKCPYYTKDGVQTKCEVLDIPATKQQQKALVRICEKQGIPIDIFTLFAEFAYPEKGTVTFAGISDATDMERFREFIRSLAPESV